MAHPSPNQDPPLLDTYHPPQSLQLPPMIPQYQQQKSVGAVVLRLPLSLTTVYILILHDFQQLSSSLKDKFIYAY